MGSNKNNATAKNRTFNFTKATQPLHGAINNATAKNWQKCSYDQSWNHWRYSSTIYKFSRKRWCGKIIKHKR